MILRFWVLRSLSFGCIVKFIIRRMAGGGAAPQPKLDELLPHPVKDQLPNVSFCITSPPPWRKLLNFFIGTILSIIFG